MFGSVTLTVGVWVVSPHLTGEILCLNVVFPGLFSLVSQSFSGCGLTCFFSPSTVLVDALTFSASRLERVRLMLF